MIWLRIVTCFLFHSRSLLDLAFPELGNVISCKAVFLHTIFSDSSQTNDATTAAITSHS